MKKEQYDKEQEEEQVEQDSAPQNEATEGEVTSEVEQEIDETETIRKELAELKDSYLRLMAEYDNYRKRTIKEKSDLIKYGGEKIVTGFLDIMDDIDLAIKNMGSAESIDGLVEGVQIIQNKFIGALKAQGVNAMEVIGEDFDADKHEAVAMVATDDAEKKGKIIDCIQTGYTLNDKVIRHPKVVVGN